MVSALRWMAAALVLLAAGCSQQPDDSDYLRVVVDIDSKLVVPEDIDSFVIEVDRGSARVFEHSYDRSVLEKLPDSLVIENPHPSNDSPEKQLYTVEPLYLRLVGYQGSTPRLWRAARVRFNAGQLQIGLPMCKDCLDSKCTDGTTCRHGTCEKWDETPSADSEPFGDPLTQCGPS